MKKRILCSILSAVMIASLMALPASAASATLNIGDISAWSGQVQGTYVVLDDAWNDASSARNVYFDFKYYNGSSWVKDKNAANLDPDDRINSLKYSNTKGASMSWLLQINTWNCWYDDCYAYGNIC